MSKLTKAKRKTWYQAGFDEAGAGMASDPPMDSGHKSHSEYVAGYADGEFQAERDARRAEGAGQ